jgi:hypothetical protein
MSTSRGEGSRGEPSSPGDQTQVQQPPERDTEQTAEERSAAARMRDGAMARTAQGRDLAARKARALRSTTAGLASGSAAGATAGRGGQAAGRAGTAPRAGGPARGNTPPSGRAPQARPQQRRGGPRRVRLTAQRVDPWSVLKISFLVSVALGIAGVVMVAVLWTVLSGMDVFSTVNDFITQVTSGETGGPSIDLMTYLGFGRVVAIAAVLGVLNVFLLTALATLTAFLYNICAALVGGAQVTLSDE